MSVEWFDLAQRLYAARSGVPVQRLVHTPFRPAAAALAVRAVPRGTATTVTVAADGTERVGSGRAALVMLADAGAGFGGQVPPTLVTDSRSTVAALEALARRHAADPDPRVGGAAAVCGWWAERAAHPGTSVVADLVALSRARYVLGTDPASERRPQVWRRWLGITDESCTGLHEWARKVGHGELLPLLENVHDDDRYSFGRWGEALTAGHDWTRPDNPAVAAFGLRSRCESAELWEAALLQDPQWRHRGVHTGHVTLGTVCDTTAAARRGRRSGVRIDCARLDSRLRAGSQVTGWVGPLDSLPYDRFHAEVRDTHVADGRLVLQLSGIGAHAPASGAAVCLIPQPPSPHTLRATRGRYRALYAQRSWLSTGHTPAPRRRDVPLDVLIAAAED